MSRNVRVMRCHPSDVFRVLADGWSYPAWVVGASRMRDVDAAWPSPGTALHHSVGAWPLVLDDETRSVEWNPLHRMVLQAKGWPIGESTVTIDAKTGGSGCVVRLQEQATKGPGTLVPNVVEDVILHVRNRETLDRLAYIAEGSRENRALP